MKPEELKNIIRDTVRTVVREELKIVIDKITETKTKKIKCFNVFGKLAETRWDDSVSLSFDTIEHDSKSNLKVLVQIEPPEIMNNNNNIINHQHWFDLILTWNEEVLAACNNAKRFIFGTCWIDLKSFKPNKKNEISYIMSNKKLTDGHELRSKIWETYSNIKIDKHIDSGDGVYDEPLRVLTETTKIKDFTFKKWFTTKTNKIESKNILFENAKFHIVVENVSRNNWITEKVIDCFATKTIPIYWGCPNIGHFFNARGILHFNTLDELTSILNSITPELYDGMADILEENYQRSKKYPGGEGFGDRIKDEINNKLKELNE